MNLDNGKHIVWVLVAAVKEIAGRSQEGFDRLEEFIMSNLAAELPPQPLHRIEPGAVGGQVEQDQPPRSTTYHRLNFIILMGAGIVPSNIDRSGWMFIEQVAQ